MSHALDRPGGSCSLSGVSARGPTIAAAADASLIAMIAEGRERAAAETELCARYRRRIFLYGVKYLRDAADAEDLVQDVLATVLERARAGEVREPDKLGSFVLGTCRMQIVGRKRVESRRARILARYHDPREAHELTEPPAVDLADRTKLQDCLARMTDRDRTILLLTFYAELDADDLGRELRLSPSNVRVTRHRALHRLQACVKDEPA